MGLNGICQQYGRMIPNPSILCLYPVLGWGSDKCAIKLDDWWLILFPKVYKFEQARLLVQYPFFLLTRQYLWLAGDGKRPH